MLNRFSTPTLSTNKPCHALVGVAMAALMIFFDNTAAMADERLEEIIANVRAHEQLYENVELAFVRRTQLVAKDVHPISASFLKDNKGFDVRETGEERFRCIFQNDLMYFHKTVDSRSVKGVPFTDDYKLAYDGALTRIVHDKNANFHQGKHENCLLIRPHTLLVDRARLCFPLSVWLEAGRRLQDYPLDHLYKKMILKVSYEKEELIDEIRAVKLRVEMKDKTAPDWRGGVYVLWLAIDRNYLPIKWEYYEMALSEDIALVFAQARDFRELGPGLWFSFQMPVTVGDRMTLQLDKRFAVSNTEEHQVEKFDLNPNYPMAFFRDIPVPKGARVYEMKGEELVNKYTEGEGQPGFEEGSSWWRWVVGLMVLAILVVGSWLIYRRARARRDPSAT